MGVAVVPDVSRARALLCAVCSGVAWWCGMVVWLWWFGCGGVVVVVRLWLW